MFTPSKTFPYLTHSGSDLLISGFRRSQLEMKEPNAFKTTDGRAHQASRAHQNFFFGERGSDWSQLFHSFLTLIYLGAARSRA